MLGVCAAALALLLALALTARLSSPQPPPPTPVHLNATYTWRVHRSYSVFEAVQLPATDPHQACLGWGGNPAVHTLPMVLALSLLKNNQSYRCVGPNQGCIGGLAERPKLV